MDRHQGDRRRWVGHIRDSTTEIGSESPQSVMTTSKLLTRKLLRDNITNLLLATLHIKSSRNAACSCVMETVDRQVQTAARRA